MQQSQDQQSFLAKLLRSVVGTDKDIYSITQDLTTAVDEKAAIEINFPFKGFFIAKIYTTATGAIDTTSVVNIKLEKKVVGSDSLECNHNFSYDSDAVYSRAFLWFAASAGKTVKIQFYKYGYVRSGTLYGASNTTAVLPSAFPLSNPVLAATTALSLAAANSLRKRLTIQNNDAASVWIGPSTVTNAGATRGIEILSGGYMEILNTAQIYGYSVLGFAAGGLTVVEET